jgi:hypothetical protein
MYELVNIQPWIQETTKNLAFEHCLLGATNFKTLQRGGIKFVYNKLTF